MELFVYCTQQNTRKASESLLFAINQYETFLKHNQKNPPKCDENDVSSPPAALGDSLLHQTIE